MRIRLTLPTWLLLATAATAQGTSVARLKVTEVTAFKDGHAFVLRAGEAAVGADGRVVLEDLPKPVLGTFWPAVQGDQAALRSVTASRHRVTLDRTALDLRQLVRANVGADVMVRETGDVRYQARILGLPTRPPEEVAASAPPGGEPPLSERSEFVLLRTDTTAPVLVLLGERVLAQGMMTYTPPGQTCDVGLTVAVDLLVKKSDRETGRTPNAVRWNDGTFTRVDLEGTLKIHNRRAEAVEVEIQRWLLGKVTSATEGGATEQISLHEDSSYLPEGLSERGLGSFGWPHWWHLLNGVGCARWTVRIEPGKEAEVGYTWQYHWR